MYTQNILLYKDTLENRLKDTMIIEMQCSISTLLDLIIWLRGIILHSDAQVSSAQNQVRFKVTYYFNVTKVYFKGIFLINDSNFCIIKYRL